MPRREGLHVGPPTLPGLVAQVAKQTGQQLVAAGFGFDGSGHDTPQIAPGLPGVRREASAPRQAGAYLVSSGNNVSRSRRTARR